MKDRLSLFAESSPLISYFEETWMFGNYPPPIWNCYERTINNIPRTNNVAEGGNLKLKTTFACSNPKIWKFIDLLRKVQAQTEFVLVQHHTGRNQPSGRKKKWKDREARIANVVRDYESRQKLDYLKRIGYLFSQ